MFDFWKSVKYVFINLFSYFFVQGLNLRYTYESTPYKLAILVTKLEYKLTPVKVLLKSIL